MHLAPCVVKSFNRDETSLCSASPSLQGRTEGPCPPLSSAGPEGWNLPRLFYPLSEMHCQLHFKEGQKKGAFLLIVTWEISDSTVRMNLSSSSWLVLQSYFVNQTKLITYIKPLQRITSKNAQMVK